MTNESKETFEELFDKAPNGWAVVKTGRAVGKYQVETSAHTLGSGLTPKSALEAAFRRREKQKEQAASSNNPGEPIRE